VTPILFGRLQTRVFAVAVIGGIWTLIITPFLPAPAGIDVGYDMTFAILLVVGVAGVAWEVLYHALQQFRWEKDWPTGLGLLTGINEGIVAWFLVDAGFAPGIDDGVPGGTFVWHFATTWVVIFLFLAGPMRVPFIRWRYKGGRLV
jgi:Kef-type K+ transport system membrane component KefB